MPPTLRRPEPVLKPAARDVDKTTPWSQAAAALQDGACLIVRDQYRTGLSILEELRRLLPAPPDDAAYEVRHAHRRRYLETSRRLLVPIVEHRVALEESPTIEFLPQLYPDFSTFVLPFAEVHILHEAWSWYEEGVHLAVLGYRVHPFYGTYVPARVAHLELFGTWLSQYKGERTRAIDVGTGCGVLALMLCKAGFARVLATDINPNAIESVRRELQRRPSPPPIDLLHGDLLGDDTTPADLIVFNPPWMRGTVEESLDGAFYFEDGLFERFFEQASQRLTPSGRVVLVFSNLIRLVQPDVPHPIEAELERGRFTLVQKLHRKARPSAREAGGRKRSTREQLEVWELARVVEGP